MCNTELVFIPDNYLNSVSLEHKQKCCYFEKYYKRDTRHERDSIVRLNKLNLCELV